jgi:signal transduction histidine kinase
MMSNLQPITRKIYILPKEFLRRYSPYSLAALTLSVLALAGWTLVHYPYDGIDFGLRTGEVHAVDPNGPASGKFRPGDQIRAVNGKDFLSAQYLSGMRPGDTETYVVFRQQDPLGANFVKLRLTLAKPPLAVLWDRLSPLLVAFIFWLLGVLVLAMGQLGDAVFIFFLFCQGITAALGFGSLSILDLAWGSRIFGLLLWWIGPLTIHTHLALGSTQSTKRMRTSIPILYTLALVASLAYLLDFPAWLAPTISYLWLGLTLLASIAVLALAFHRSRDVEKRRKLGLLALAALTGFLPFVLLSLIPEAVFGQPILKYQTTFLALPILPLGYSFAILRYRLIRLESYVNRSAAYVLAATFVAAIYGLVYLAAPQLMPGKDHRLTALGLVAVAGLIFLANPLYLQIQRLVNRIFYGSWYDDRAAVQQISQALDHAAGDSAGIAVTLCKALQKTMQLEHAGLLLNSGQIVSTHSGLGESGTTRSFIDAQSSEHILNSIYATTGKEAGRAAELVDILPLEHRERIRLLGGKPQLWLLLNGSRGALGLLVLGERRGGEFDAHDREILEVVVRQAKAALESAALLEEVRLQSEQVRHLHRELLQAREAERKRLARDLHDQTIQSLVGLNYRIAGTRAKAGLETTKELLELQDQVRHILSDLRAVCADLRPPALDNLGLVPTLQARAAELANELPMRIEFQVDGDQNQEISEAASLCLYRVFQEALQNVVKHAGAQRVLIRLKIEPSMVSVCVQDDGCGFLVPSRLESLSNDHHFGLVGLQELVESLQGSLALDSDPGRGVTLVASVPGQAA